MGDQLVGCAPIADDEAVEAPLSSQDIGQGMVIGRGGNAVEVVKSRHQSSSARLDRSMKWRQVDFAQQLLGNIYGVVVAAAFDCSISDVVFGAGDNAIGIRHVLALKATYFGRGDN